MLDSLARLMFRRRRRVLVGAVLFVIFAGVVGGPIAGLLDSDTTSTRRLPRRCRRARRSRTRLARRPRPT